MSRMFQAVQLLDRLGLRRPLAALGSMIAYGRRFEVDAGGRWVNRQCAATFVSPSIHVTPYDQVHSWVLDNWCWDYVPREGDVVIDVGAGIGEETVVFSKLVGATGRVISIEAHPETFACLKRTVACSGLANVTAMQCAVADADGEISMGTAECHVASSIVDGGDIRVEARSLDSLSAELGLDRIAFLKMNIEGAERLAIRGMAGILPHIHAMCISCHDFIADLGGSDDFRTKADVQPVLEQAGFSIRTRPESQESWVRGYLYARRAE